MTPMRPDIEPMPSRLSLQQRVRSNRTSQTGLGAIAAIIVLVMLAALAAAVVRLGWATQTTVGQDVQGARALQAANAGVQWGLYQALLGTWGTCGTGSQNINLRPTMDFTVTVTCSYSSYNEGESVPNTPRVIKVYTIEAVACTSSTACPDSTLAASLTYVERKRQVTATDKSAEE
jgi:MSHA biogenesis protein MshP